ncbi:MAG: oxoglutarate dehydrogenase (succinyl-transferring), component, partial [Actinomycetota bacterium]
QGPDHSSARVERFLMLCAQDNMTVAMPTTPASYFHLLRWQAISPLTRPLIVFTPKSLLRAKYATSAMSEFTSGHFRAVIKDDVVNPAEVRKVLICSGKVYFDLLAEREKRGVRDVAIVRMERLYPLPTRTLPEAFDGVSADAKVSFVQEEPSNQGAWPFMSMHLSELLGRHVSRVSRPASSSPAVGSHHRHEVEQAALVEAAFE